MSSPEILVGVDGSPSSRQALRWAARAAVDRSCGLRVVHAYEWRVVGARAQVAGAEAKAGAEELVAAAVDEVRSEQPGLRVRGEALLGATGPVLVAAARESLMAVVGSRGRGGFSGLLLGSVSQQVATHATVPVVVVRGLGVATGPIVVGVDGSGPADHALGLAFAEAERQGLRVVAVRVYSALQPGWGSDLPAYVENPDERRDEEREILQHSVVAWSDKYPTVPVDTIAQAGHPAEVLANMSDGASLLVVGNRGHGGFVGLLVGSTGLQLLHHANCPVLLDRPGAGTH